MNNLQPEERRAKADEIARLLENEPLMVQDLIPLLRSSTVNLLGSAADAKECDSCSGVAQYCGECMRAAENRCENLECDLEDTEAQLSESKRSAAERILTLEEKVKNLERATAYNPPGR